MSMSLFELAGGLLANGPGVLMLAALAASTVLIWDWRWALVSSALLLLGISSIGAALHSVPAIITAGQWLAIIVATLLLGLSARVRSSGMAAHTNANWLLRALALGFLLGAWWLVDPGVSLPRFTQVETDLLIWIALCGLLMLSLTASPLFVGIGLLLLLAPLQSIAPVLAPGAGLSIFVGIAQILTALACAYLTLAQPVPTARARRVLAPLSASRAAAPPVEQQQTGLPSHLPRPALRRPAFFAARTPPVSAAPPEPQPEPPPAVEERV